MAIANTALLETSSGSAKAGTGGFPPGFLWGAATAAYQIEGAAHAAGRGESIWDRFSHTPGKVANNETGDVACDHYHRFREDVAMMRDLGLSAYRFSVAWPRVVPAGSGAVNEAGLDFYSRLVDTLLAAGIEPWITLYHWDLPQALEDKGGWANPDTAAHFGDYAEATFRALGDRVSNWITLNEPWCSAHLGYASGDHAPGHKDQTLALAAGHGLLLGHGQAVQRFRSVVPNGSIGITLNMAPVHPATDTEGDRGAAARWNAYLNRWFLDPVYKGDYPEEMREGFGDALPTFTPAQRASVSSPIDFVGVNYYSRSIMRNKPDNAFLQIDGASAPEGAEKTGMGWEVYPDGLREILAWVDDTYGHPLQFITESGAGYEETPGPDGMVHDENRLSYLRRHFQSARAALDEGVNLGGYFVWSLMDNFEWAYGYAKRFGIVSVDYATQTRTPKSSARWYSMVIRENAVVDE